jgi:hypothetical protein
MEPSLFCERLVRWNSPYINHFIQPDTIIPDQTNPQSWDRYSYTLNNPVRYTDPSGHSVCEDYEGTCVSENQLTKITRFNLIRKRHYKDQWVKDDNEPTPSAISSTGTSGQEVVQQTLGSVNYNFGPNGVTLYNGPVLAGVVPIGDLNISWSPSLTLNNGSQVIVSPSSITYGQPGAVSPRVSITVNGPSMGYVDSPIFNSPALSGLSVQFPKMGQLRISATTSVRSQSVSYVSKYDVTYTSRPDYAAVAAAPVAVGSFLILQAQKATMGIPFCPNGVTC